jgi:hypothetical protein
MEYKKVWKVRRRRSLAAECPSFQAAGYFPMPKVKAFMT